MPTSITTIDRQKVGHNVQEIGNKLSALSVEAAAAIAELQGGSTEFDATDPIHLVRAATTGALAAATYSASAKTLTADAPGALGAIDGVTLAVGERLFYKDHGTATRRGIYTVTNAGGAGAWVLTRASDFDESADLKSGTIISVSEGTANGNRMWTLDANEPTGGLVLDTSNLTFTKLPDLADLASTANGKGASLIGIEDAAGNFNPAADVEAALAEIFTTVASTNPAKGAALVGYDGGTTVKAALDTIVATGVGVASKAVVFGDLTDADQQQDVAFDAALPAGAVIVGYGANVTAAFDNAGDAATLTFDLGTGTGLADLVDGGSLNAVAKVSTPAPAAGHPSLVGAVTPSIRIDSDVNLNTLAKGAATFYVLYVLAF